MYQIDSLSRTPVYEQIVEQTKRFILSKILNAGDQLESVRSIAYEHSINPRTILKAYNDLDFAGIVKAVPGKGYFVCDEATEILNKENRKKLNELFEIFSQMNMAGITKSEIIECVEKAYAGEKNIETEDSNK